MAKNYMSALIVDSDDDYQQKQITLSGIAEIYKEIRIQLAADLKMHMTKLFGISSAGFNAGDDDIENYNAMVEGEVRAKSKGNLIQIINLVSQKLFGYSPDDLTIEFEPLRMLTHEQEENIKNQQQNRILNLYDRQLMTSEETISAHNTESLVGSLTIEVDKEPEQDEAEGQDLQYEETHKIEKRKKFEPQNPADPRTVKDPDSEYGLKSENSKKKKKMTSNGLQ
jgi:hypothetical protein